MSDELSDAHIGTVVTTYCPTHPTICDGADLDCCCSYRHRVDRHPHPIDALCARHDIDIDGIVRLVDAALTGDAIPIPDLVAKGYSHGMAEDFVEGGYCVLGHLRRLARGES